MRIYFQLPSVRKIVVCILLRVFPSVGLAVDWSQYNGPLGDNSSPESIRTNWTASLQKFCGAKRLGRDGVPSPSALAASSPRRDARPRAVPANSVSHSTLTPARNSGRGMLISLIIPTSLKPIAERTDPVNAHR